VAADRNPSLFTKTPLKKYDLPYTTAPFVIVATIIVLSTLALAVDGAASDLPDEPCRRSSCRC